MAHFNGLRVNPLGFLKDDATLLKRLAIRFLLGRWDISLRHIPDEFLAGRTVLDACCGNPRIVCWMQSRGAEAFGCDLSINMLTMGNAGGYSYALGERVLLAPVRWTLADCEELPFPDSAFDTVTCFQSLHHVDAGRFLEECRRVLKPGGNLVISDPNGGHPLRKSANRLGRSLGLLSKDEGSMPPREVMAMLARHGFVIDKYRSINFLSEIVFLMEEILRERRPALSALLRASLLLFYPLDAVLDATLFRIFPRLAWRCIFIAEKRF